MSRSYHPIKTVEHLCDGPNEEIKLKSPVKMEIERGVAMFENVVFSRCNHNYEKFGEQSYCKLSGNKKIPCKYSGEKANKELNRILDSK